MNEQTINTQEIPSAPSTQNTAKVKNNTSIVIFIYAFCIVLFFAVIILFSLFGKKDTDNKLNMLSDRTYPWTQQAMEPVVVETVHYNSSNTESPDMENTPPAPGLDLNVRSGPAAVSVWKKADFLTFADQVWCEGSRYVGYSQRYALWVGAELCASRSEYKLYMSDSEHGVYHQIADASGNGQDHCELVNRSFTIPNDDDITSGTCKTCSLGEMFDVQDEPVYVRSRLGEVFQTQNSRYWGDLTVKSYSCGVEIK